MSARKTNHAYILVLGIDPLQVGERYDRERHCSIMLWFKSVLTVPEISGVVEPVFEASGPVKLLSESAQNFGSAESPIPVFELHKTAELAKLHTNLQKALAESGAEFVEPQYTGEAWRPHVSTQPRGDFPVGSEHVAQFAYLIEAANGDIPKGAKEVRYRYELGA